MTENAGYEVTSRKRRNRSFYADDYIRNSWYILTTFTIKAWRYAFLT